MKKVLVLFASVFTLTLGVGAASMPLDHDSTWEYGTAIQGNASKKVWSNLMSKKKSHSTSVKIGNRKAKSAIVKKNKWAKSSTYGSAWEVGHSYFYFH